VKLGNYRVNFDLRILAVLFEGKALDVNPLDAFQDFFDIRIIFTRNAVPASNKRRTGVTFRITWKRFFIVRSSHLMLIANCIELRHALRPPLRHIEFGAHQPQRDQHLFLFS